MRESLETIAQREQEIRGRLLRARASAEAIVAAARAEAERIRTEGEATAAAEARAWLDEQAASARQEAETSVARATAHLDDQEIEGPVVDEAVQLILEAVLMGPTPLPGG